MVGEFDNPFLGRMPADAAAAAYCANRGEIVSQLDETAAMPKITGFSSFFEKLDDGQIISGFVTSSETPDGTTHNAIEAKAWVFNPQAKKVATLLALITLTGLPRDTTSGGQI